MTDSTNTLETTIALTLDDVSGPNKARTENVGDEAMRRYKLWCKEESALCGNAMYRVGGVNGPAIPEWAYEEAHEDGEFAKHFSKIICHPRTPNGKIHMRKLLRKNTGEISDAEVAFYRNLTKGEDMPSYIDSWLYELAFLLHFPDGMSVTSGATPQVGMGVDAIKSASAALNEGIYAQEGAILEIRKSLENDMVKSGMIEAVCGIEDIDPLEFEEKVMKDFPDYFGVLVRMGLSPERIPLNPNDLPAGLYEMFSRAAVRVELQVTSRRLKTDITYANDMFDRKYKKRGRELPYIPTPEALIGNEKKEREAAEKLEMLPSWLPPSDALAPAPQVLENSLEVKSLMEDKKEKLAERAKKAKAASSL